MRGFMQTRLAFLVMAVAIAVSGCASNAFEKFYTPSRSADNILSSPFYVKPPKEPKLYEHSNNLEADAKRLQEEGYACIGTSSFFGPSKVGEKSKAIAQGEKVGAALVMIRSNYKDTLSGTTPLVLPNAPQVATVNTNGTVYGYNGSASYNSTSTVTMPGGSTTYNIPYNITRSDFFASYWVMLDPAKMRLGTRTDSLPDNVRSRLKRNTGAYVLIVVRGTPAFAANVMEGDVIVKVNEEEVVDGPSFLKQLAQYQGESVILGLIRDGIPIDIRVPLKAQLAQN